MQTFARLLRFVLTHPLARRRPVAALARLLRWQLGGRLLGLPAVMDFVPPTRLLLRRGLSSATANWYVGLTDPAEMALVMHLLRPTDLMGDVGANVGVYSVLAAGVARAEVVAIEPSPDAVAHLRDTIGLNDLAVTVVPMALGAEPGLLRLSARRGAANRVLLPGETDAAMEIASTTLDAIFAERTPLLLKLDVEGYEARVLAGATRLLTDPALRVLIVETTGHAERYGGDVDAMLRAQGFAPHDYDPRRRTLTPRAGPGAPNTIYLRDAPFCDRRVAEAEAFTVLGERY